MKKKIEVSSVDYAKMQKLFQEVESNPDLKETLEGFATVLRNEQDVFRLGVENLDQLVNIAKASLRVFETGEEVSVVSEANKGSKIIDGSN